MQHNGLSTVRTRPDPPHADILHGFRRATTKDRDRFISHINQMEAEGALKPELARQRVADAEAAETTWDLGNLIDDLPPFPEPLAGSVRKALRSPQALFGYCQANFDKRPFRWVFHTLIAVLAVAWAVIPSVFLAQLHHPLDLLMVFFIITGTIVLIANLIAAVLFADR